MADYIARRPVRGVFDHPTNGELSIVMIGRYTVCYPREKAEKLRLRQQIIHIPPGICINPKIAAELGIDDQLGKRLYLDSVVKTHCFVLARLVQGKPSMGFLVEDCSLINIGDDLLDSYFGVWKPDWFPVEHPEGMVEFKDHPQFPQYSEVRRIQRRSYTWAEGLPVRVTELLHGVGVRLGVVKLDDGWRFMVGSQELILREHNDHNKRNPFWNLLDNRVLGMLNHICDSKHPVVIYAQLIGPGVKNLDYGLDKPDIRVYDLLVDNIFQPWEKIESWCGEFRIHTVPLLSMGSFSWCLVDNFTNGFSIVTNPGATKSSFKGRKGIVITPLEETTSSHWGGRLIGKSVSVNYEAHVSSMENY